MHGGTSSANEIAHEHRLIFYDANAPPHDKYNNQPTLLAVRRDIDSASIDSSPRQSGPYLYIISVGVILL